MRIRLRLLAPAAAVGMACAFVNPAAGFYFPGWPGAGVPKPRTLIPPNIPPEGNPPSAQPPGTDGEPVRPPRDRNSLNEPSQTPEPGTLTIALLGLAAVGARVAMRRKKKCETEPGV
jgi:hypothetical protein